MAVILFQKGAVINVSWPLCIHNGRKSNSEGAGIKESWPLCIHNGRNSNSEGTVSGTSKQYASVSIPQLQN